jgi:hypothetical protein
MTFQTAVWAVDGNTVAGALARLMLQASTLGAQGVVGHLDCQVQATTPSPTAGIVITPGQVVVLGQESSYQGSYHGWNVGNDTSLSIAATSGAARSDMIVARAEDPTWPGSPWGGPAAGQIIWPRVISGVSSSATQAPGGISAIALARIDMPPSTSVVNAAYIHDLRQVAVPQNFTFQLSAAGPGSGTNWTTGGSTVAWPPGASWPVAIPAWATYLVLMWEMNQIQWVSGWARANVWPVFGSSVTSPVLSFPQALVSIQAAAGPYRHTIGGSATVFIPASLRGTTQTLQFAQAKSGQTGVMQADEGSSVAVIGTFQQQAVLA